jgi:uncharacterized membrane protein
MDQERIVQKEGKIYRTPEGRVLWAGVVMTLCLGALIVWYAVEDPGTAKTLTLAFFANAFGGRAAGVGLCTLNGIAIPWTILYNFYVEVIVVFFSYSLFILSINNVIRLTWIVNYAAKVMNQAAARKEMVERYGWIGVFLFVMIPLPMTGPVVGSIIGYLLRLDLWKNFSAVFLGTLAAIIAWVYCFDLLNAHLHLIQYIIIAIIAVVLFSYLREIRDWFRKRG